MAITIPDDFRATYPVTTWTPAQLRSIMQGRLNVGLGPLLITVGTAQPWVIEDPRVSPQSIIVPCQHDDEAAKVIASGWWIDISVPGVITFNSIKNTIVHDIRLSFGIIG